jgi:hypothetical protein
LRAIWADPDTYRQVETAIQKFTSGGTLPERSLKLEPKKGDETPQGAKVDPTLSDLKVAEENRVLNDFFNKYGYSSLSEKERKDSYSRLAVSLAELVDPAGKRPMREILSSIPLTKLPRYLENAHFIANKEKMLNHAKSSALLSQEENRAGAIGSFAASSGQPSEGVTLTNREREVASKMGISEEAYGKRKMQIVEEAKRFD